MKRYFLFVFVFIFTLLSCNNNTTSSKQEHQKEEINKESTENESFFRFVLFVRDDEFSKKMIPVMYELQEKHPIRINIEIVDLIENPHFIKEFEIEFTPLLIIFDIDNNEHKRLYGYKPLIYFDRMLKKYLE